MGSFKCVVFIMAFVYSISGSQAGNRTRFRRDAVAETISNDETKVTSINSILPKALYHVTKYFICINACVQLGLRFTLKDPSDTCNLLLKQGSSAAAITYMKPTLESLQGLHKCTQGCVLLPIDLSDDGNDKTKKSPSPSFPSEDEEGECYDYGDDSNETETETGGDDKKEEGKKEEDKKEDENGEDKKEDENGEDKKVDENEADKKEDENGEDKKEDENGEDKKEDENEADKKEDENGEDKKEDENGADKKEDEKDSFFFSPRHIYGHNKFGDASDFERSIGSGGGVKQFGSGSSSFGSSTGADFANEWSSERSAGISSHHRSDSHRRHHHSWQ